MVNDEILYIRRRLKKKMDEDRFEHTIGVAYTSVCLAMRYGEDLHKAELAGLLHDCAKCIPDDIKLDKCKRNNIPITKAQEHDCLAGKAYANISRRITGEDVPFLDLEVKQGVFGKLMDLFKKN